MKYFTHFIFSVLRKYMLNHNILVSKEKESFVLLVMSLFSMYLTVEKIGMRNN